MSRGIESPPATRVDQEHRELEALLASGIFGKASGLAQLLTYICNKYFEGATEEIKEYNIGVEALGRPPEFDQKKDSIVRVEAHRLRKRLREYYEGAGADHAVHIVLPAGQYVPHFIFQQPEETAVIAKHDEKHDEPPLPPLPVPVASRSLAWRPPWLWAAAAVLLLGSLGAVQVYRNRQPGQAFRALAATDLTALPDSAVIRIRAGFSEPYTDRSGNKWEPDQFFQGGWVFDSPHQQIAGTPDPRIYQTRREGLFRYDIPLKPGNYEMRLHFAETVYGENNVGGGGESSRVFSVFANGKKIVQELDVVSDVGSNTADIRAFKDISPANDGKLHLTFEQHSNAPILSAIEIASAPRGKIWPIRLVAQDRTYIDGDGHTWEPDGYAKGGQLVSRTGDIANTEEPELYRGERFGNIQYTIPVPPGQYGVVLHFAEAWFGAASPGKGGAGSRLFDILCNGVALKRNLDVYREAGVANRAFTWSAHGLEPNQQGKLVISLLPQRNYAEVNALEIIDESH